MFANLRGRDITFASLLLLIGVLLLSAGWFGAREFQKQMLQEQAQGEALHWATYLERHLNDLEGVLSNGWLTDEDQEVLDFVVEGGRVIRYQFYNAQSEIVLASRSSDVGLINSAPYFTEIVKRGGVVAELKEGVIFAGRETSITEAYAPFLKNGVFVGAIKLHVDASEQAQYLESELNDARLGLVMAFAVISLVIGLLIARNVADRNRELNTVSRAHDSMAKAEEEVRNLNQDLENRVNERTAELNEANKRATELNQELEQRVEERTAQVSKIIEQLYKANESVTKLNEGLEQRVEERTAELNAANERVTNLNQDLEQRVEERTAELNAANERVTNLNQDLEQRVQERTAELNAANESITNLNQDLERRVEERTAELNAASERVNKLNQELEQRVQERTAELNTANERIMKLNQGLEQRVEERTAELKEAQLELVQNERLAALGQLTATVSHELRNPLGAIRTAIYLIRGRTESQGLGVESALERADRSILRCDSIINELLDFTRSTPLALEDTTFDSWLSAVLDEQTLPANVTLEKLIDTGDLRVAFDQERFRRVIINLFNNACEALVEASNNGQIESEPRLQVSTATNNNRMEVRFQDNGPGIPQDVLEKIFEPLYSTKSFGVGLGLPTVRQIMEQHGGSIEITSEMGKGTNVHLWLPLNRAGERAA